MDKNEKRWRKLARELATKADDKRLKAKRIHEAPSLFLDRDHEVIALQCEARGIQYAAMRILEVLCGK